MTKALKHTILGLLAALLALSAAYILTKPAEQAKADSTYSETWVIKEGWTGSENFSVSVPFSLNGLETTFSSFSIEISNSSSMLKVKEGDSEKYISYSFSQGNCSYFNTLKDISDTPFGSTVDYTTWKDGFGRITFFADTSTAEYSALRTWLEANATKIVYTVTFNDGTSVLKTVTANYGTKASEINVSTLAPEKEGYTFKGWSRTNGGEVVDLSTVTINQSMAFFAVYEKQTFEIKFMDGETLLKTVTVDYGTNLSAISLTGVNTDKTGFTFRGWALSNGGTVVNSETYSVKSAVNFYAVYDVAGKATVVFKDGATSLKTVTVDLGAKASEIDISDLELEKNGYKFKGWSNTEGGDVIDLETVSVNEYTVLYAVYEKGTNNILDNASEWLTSKTGVAFSATGVIVLALGLYLILRRR